MCSPRPNLSRLVLPTELTADSMNDAGFATAHNIKDEYIEWLNQERNVSSGGKVLAVNDADQGS